MSSITQIIVTCAFSVLACVLRCTVQTHKEKAVNFIFFSVLNLLFCVVREGRYLVFGLFLLRPFNASVRARHCGNVGQTTTKKELH